MNLFAGNFGFFFFFLFLFSLSFFLFFLSRVWDFRGGCQFIYSNGLLSRVRKLTINNK